MKLNIRTGLWACVIAICSTTLVGCMDNTFDEIPDLYNTGTNGGDEEPVGNTPPPDTVPWINEELNDITQYGESV